MAGVRVHGRGDSGGSVRPLGLGVGDGAPSHEGCGQDGQGQEGGSQGHGTGVDGCHIASTPSLYCQAQDRCQSCSDGPGPGAFGSGFPSLDGSSPGPGRPRTRARLSPNGGIPDRRRVSAASRVGPLAQRTRASVRAVIPIARILTPATTSALACREQLRHRNSAWLLRFRPCTRRGDRSGRYPWGYSREPCPVLFAVSFQFLLHCPGPGVCQTPVEAGLRFDVYPRIFGGSPV